MKKYELSEFIFLLRLGVWRGGEIVGIGYVSAARKGTEVDGLAGLMGFPLGSGVMLEQNRSYSYGETDMTFSVYDPYSGAYDRFTVTAGCDGNMEEVLLAVLNEAERENMITSARKSAAYVSIRSKRKYVAEYSSMRGGKVPAPRKTR
jgi:hypothetical protein